MATLTVSPQSALVDEEVTISIKGLEPYQLVTLLAMLRGEKVQMASHAFYKANADGIVDVTTMESLGGSYTGVEPMGFIWSMVITEDYELAPRFMKRNVSEPVNIEVQCVSGHIAFDKAIVTSNVMASAHIERWYLGDDVERVDVREGRVIATMFIPKGEGPFPGVLDLFGSIGGLVEYRASLLASRGFVTMALAYYYPPDDMKTDLEYFEEALEILWRHPKVLKTGLGTIGVSKGAELICLIATVIPKVKAVVPINGPPYGVIEKCTYKGETFPIYEFDAPDFEIVQTDEGFLFDYGDPNTSLQGDPQYLIPIERSQAKFLLIHGADDKNTSQVSTEVFPKRLAPYGRDGDVRALIYEGAGHLIEPPFSPHFRRSFHKMLGEVFVWGGETKAHARAQEDSWREIQNFLRETLIYPEQTAISKL